MPRSPQPHAPHPQDESEPEPHPGAEPCPGYCNAAYRAAEARVRLHGGEHDLDPRPGEPVWCAPCVTSLRGALDDWPALAARLRDEITSGVRAQTGEYVSGSKTRPIHEHEAPSLLLDEVAEWLPEWAATIARERGLPARAGARRNADPVTVIGDACAFLCIHLDWHLNGRGPGDEQREVAREFGETLARHTRRAKTITASLNPEPLRVVGVPCPMCDRKTLEHELEDSPTKRARVSQYVYREDGSVETRRRAAAPGEVSALRLRRPADKHGRPVEHWEPTIPEHAIETTSAAMAGAATGYIRCRHCKPIFRMTPQEYTRWIKLLDRDARARGLDVEDKLARVLGSRALGNCASPALPRIEEGTAA